VKVIIPLAGKGTRLRPHTYVTPKPLLKVAGKPVMSYILDDLQALGVEEIIFITGYLKESIEAYIRQEYPAFRSRFVEQKVQDGTAGAVNLARPYVDEEVMIIFVDTIFDADLSLTARMPNVDGILWAKYVEDYQRFGVIVNDDDGFMRQIVEKPTEPVSKLANIGLYYIRDWQLLFKGIEEVVSADPGPGGEYFLTDAFQYMIDQGARLKTVEVDGWYDCGKPETLLETNRHLLETSRGARPDAAPGVTVHDPVRVAPGVRLEDCEIGPNVTLGPGTVVRGSTLRDTIVGANSEIDGCRLHDTLLGDHVRIRGMRGSVNLVDHSEVVGE
jgi:glucose-1-phosphate thymidylyltransferase